MHENTYALVEFNLIDWRDSFLPVPRQLNIWMYLNVFVCIFSNMR